MLATAGWSGSQRPSRPASTQPDSLAQLTALLSLPDEVLLTIAEWVLASDLPSAMRLSYANHRLAEALSEPLRKRAELRRLQWQPNATVGHVVTNNGRTLTRLGGKWTRAWAIGPLLPTSGRFSWKVRIDRCAENEGVMCIGVCDADGKNAYGIAPYSGRLSSLCCSALGGDVVANTCPPDEHAECTFTKQVMVDAAGEATSLKRRANGALIHLTVDADIGSVHMAINKGEPVLVIGGLPDGTQLRPWVRLFDVGDRISCSGYWTPLDARSAH